MAIRQKVENKETNSTLINYFLTSESEIISDQSEIISDFLSYFILIIVIVICNTLKDNVLLFFGRDAWKWY